MTREDDAISRQAVIEILGNYGCTNREGLLFKEIELLPPVTPKPMECEDAVSKADILQKYDKYCEDNCPYSKKQRDVMCGACFMGDAIEIVEDLPPVTPKQRTGKWIWEFNDIEGEVRFTCSSCGEFQLFETDFCPNCGAKMGGE